MLWFYTALIAAILFAAVAVISKEVMEDTSAVTYTSIYAVISTAFYLPVFLYYISTTHLDTLTQFAPFILLSGLANVFGILALNHGLKKTDLSIAMPLSRLQPVFVAVLGVIILHEVITLSLGSGIILVTLGSYIVLLENRTHFLEPFTNLKTDRGAQLSLASAAVFGVAAVTDRYVTQTLDPKVYTFFILLTMAIAINGYLQGRNGDHIETFRNELSSRKIVYSVAGLAGAGAYLSILTALSLAEASKVIPVLQVQIPLTIIAGGQIFGETHVLQKLLGSLILIAGIVLVAM